MYTLLVNPTESNSTHPCQDHQTPLHLAAKRGHLAVCTLLLDRGIEVNAVDKNTASTAMHLASANGFLGVCQLLLGRGANINAVDKVLLRRFHYCRIMCSNDCLGFIDHSTLFTFRTSLCCVLCCTLCCVPHTV